MKSNKPNLSRFYYFPKSFTAAGFVPWYAHRCDKIRPPSKFWCVLTPAGMLSIPSCPALRHKMSDL